MRRLRDVVTRKEAKALESPGFFDAYAIAVDDAGIAYTYVPMEWLVGKSGAQFKTLREAMRYCLPGDIVVLAPGHQEEL
jgi:hypothetical protein